MVEQQCFNFTSWIYNYYTPNSRRRGLSKNNNDKYIRKRIY